MVSFLEAILFGIIQGITEWLPVSSTGHLAILSKLFSFEQPVVYVVAVHLASLIALIIFFRNTLLGMAKNLFNFKSEENRLFLYVIVGTLPLVFIGVFIFDFMVRIFDNFLLK